MKRGVFYLLCSLMQASLSLSLLGVVKAQSASDLSEVQRTWQAAHIFSPGEGPMGKSQTRGSEFSHDVDLSNHSVVIYAHGCAGLDRAAQDAGNFLSHAGFVVIQPDSFARHNKPQSCDPSVPKGGLHRAVLGWRHAEIDYAIKQVKSLGPRAPAHIFLMGLSEGAITTATYKGEALSGRIIEGWTCHAGWPEYIGLNSPKSEPVLSLVADRDPWFKLPVLQGDCSAYMGNHATAQSVVFAEGSPLREHHWLSFDASVKALILAFLAVNTK